MDGQRFDALARTLASGMTRRRGLKALVGAVTGAAVAAVGLDDAEARQVCRVAGQVCRKPGDCCSKFCGPANQFGRQYCDLCPDDGLPCGAGSCCDRGESCLNGECCANSCGDGPGAVCCADGQTCIQEFNGNGYDYSCCDSTLACNDNTVCCSGGDTCVLGGCCTPQNVCNQQCCGAGTSCTLDGCCESPCVAGQNSYCCESFQTCDPVEGCVGIG